MCIYNDLAHHLPHCSPHAYVSWEQSVTLSHVHSMLSSRAGRGLCRGPSALQALQHGEFTQSRLTRRPAIAGLDARPAQGQSVDRAPHDPPSREALPGNLLSAFARNSDRGFSEDQGRPPLSGRRSTDTEVSRSSAESAAGPFGEPPTRTSVERLNRSGPQSAGQQGPAVLGPALLHGACESCAPLRLPGAVQRPRCLASLTRSIHTHELAQPSSR